MKFVGLITHYEKHFNYNCHTMIPEYWECQLVEMPEKIAETYGHLNIYGTSQESALDATMDLINQLKNNGWHGKLKIIQ